MRDTVNQNVRKLTLVFGSGAGKTSVIQIRLGFGIQYIPGSGIMILPATNRAGGSRAFVKNRFIPNIKATPCLAELIPAGQERYCMNMESVAINGSHTAFVGSKSAGQVVGPRNSLIVMDEKEKYPKSLGEEAGTSELVAGSVEGVAEYLIINTSTPSVESGLIWQDLLQSNFMLNFVPCPHCNGGKHGQTEEDREIEAKAKNFKGWFIYAWSEQFAAGLPHKFMQNDPALKDRPIPMAFVKWPKEKCQRPDKSWNLEKVMRETYVECPHCKGQIRDIEVLPDANQPLGRIKLSPATKIWMDENCFWLATQDGDPRHVGYQLGNLSAPVINEESTFGGRAVKFLNACDAGGEAIRDIINARLGLVEVAQEFTDKSIVEISSGDEPRVSSTLRWPEMSVDRQAKYPGFWFRVRKWVASILRAQLNPEERKSFLEKLPTEQKNLSEKITGTLMSPQGVLLYSPHWISANLQRTDHWPEIFNWLLTNGIMEKRLQEFFQVEFQGDLIRMIDFICAEKQANIKIGKQGDSECVEFGSADSWEEIDEAQRRWKISNPDVICDARFGAMDNAEVFAECFRRCPQNGFCFFSPLVTPFGPRGKFSKTPMPGYKPFAEWGWTPALGYPEHKVWPSKEKIRLPYAQEVNDPFIGKMEARKFYQYVFKFDAQWALSELARIRKRYSFTLARDCKIYGHNAEMHPVTLADYNLHMKGYFWNEREQCWEAPGKQGGSQSRKHPNHLYDCEKNGAARAVWKGIFKYERSQPITQDQQ